MRKVHVLDANLSRVIPGIMRRARMSRRSERRASIKMREALRAVLLNVIKDAYADGSAPYRTGRSKRIMLKGVRAFGQTFNGIRGHILGPEYIAAHEHGATIRPKQAKALAIPLPAALRPDGTPKLPGPRSWKNVLKTFLYKSKKTGRMYVAYKNAGGSLTLLYVLVQEVEIRKKRFLSEAWDNRRDQLMIEFGNIMMYELSTVDLLSLARVTTSKR